MQLSLCHQDLLLVTLRVLGTSSVVGQLILEVSDLLCRLLLHELHQSTSENLASHTQVTMNSGTRGLEDRSTSGGISSTNHLSPLLRTSGSEGLFGTLWRSLTSSTSASCNRTRISANSKLLRRVLNHSVDPVHVKISCDQVHPRRIVGSQRSHSPNTVHAPSYCHHTDDEQQTGRTFNQAVRQPLLRYHVRVRNGFLVTCGGIGPQTAFLANQTPVCCGCPARTRGCDLVSTVRLDQSANPVAGVVGSRVACCEVLVESWSFRTLVFALPHSSTARSWSRAGRLWDQH